MNKSKNEINEIEEKKELLEDLYNIYRDYKNTSLYIEGANSIVFGEGNSNSKIVFIGEAPGRDEDLQARPFVGRSGKLLTIAIENAGMKRSDVFITNIVKCRPPENRVPTNFEIEKGKNLILIYELQIIKPTIIVTLGLSALRGLIPEIDSMTKNKGKIIDSIYGKIFPIYHPAFVLRNMNMKNIFFEDIKKIFNYVL